MRFCSKCGAQVNDDAQFCFKCGNALHKPASNNNSSGFMDGVKNYFGADHADLNWKILFNDVMNKHTSHEAEEIFICGTQKTTPDLSLVSSKLPRPWLYSRVFIFMIITFFLLWICTSAFANSNALPGLIVVGSFAVPLSTLVLFLEVNVWKNISFFKVMQIFMVGGCASLVATLILFRILPLGTDNFINAFMVGLIEELGKAVIVCYFLSKVSSAKILPAMLIGACIGAGFAAFESAGYAFNFLYQGGFSTMMDVIFLRAFLAPGGHVAWAAISGAAMVIAAKKLNTSISFGLFTQTSFLKFFIIPIIMHGIWDSPITASFLPEIHGVPILLLIAVWIVILILINLGLAEVSAARKSNN
ncbi:MAG: PrsW family intramembrane metalloprotease [Bacteroidaceae bacterium]|nr:PrsW family intramembrane metalloprotease [Bacteroidaceae bacterium]